MKTKEEQHDNKKNKKKINEKEKKKRKGKKKKENLEMSVARNCIFSYMQCGSLAALISRRGRLSLNAGASRESQ